jgi:hypothetical protein
LERITAHKQPDRLIHRLARIVASVMGSSYDCLPFSSGEEIRENFL